MPIIYRPETDTQRLKALQAAKSKADAVVGGGGSVAFGPGTAAALNTFLPTFNTEMQQRGSALSVQTAATAAANPTRKILNIFIRHFITVFNMGVERGRYPATDRGHYQLPVDYHKLPKLSSDADLTLWAGNIIDGDAARVLAGGEPMENPTAAQVATANTDLQTALSVQTTAKDAYDLEQEDVENLREEADELIADIWDEVLFTFRKDEAPSMRRKAREYGVVYRLSPGETPDPGEYSLQGRVTSQATLTPGGPHPPLADVQVRAVEDNITVVTDIDGNYLMPVLSTPNNTIEFSKPGFVTRTENVVLTPGAVLTLDVELTPEP